jgi:hypothetical protein
MMTNTRPTSAPATSRQPGAPKPASAATNVALMNPARQESLAPTEEDIAKRAYEIWLSLGREPGQDQKHWFEAERQLRQQGRQRK